MKNRYIFFALFYSVFGAVCTQKNPAAPEQYFTLKGKVLDRSDQTPVSEAILTLDRQQDTTDAEGQFEFTKLLEWNRYTLSISHPHFSTFDTTLTLAKDSYHVFWLDRVLFAFKGEVLERGTNLVVLYARIVLGGIPVSTAPLARYTRQVGLSYYGLFFRGNRYWGWQYQLVDFELHDVSE